MIKQIVNDDKLISEVIVVVKDKLVYQPPRFVSLAVGEVGGGSITGPVENSHYNNMS